jgi:hypothetical protein
MYLVPAFFAVNGRSNARGMPVGGYCLLSAFLLMMIGFRETGGDYSTYKAIFYVISDRSLQDALRISDPAFALLDWTSSQLSLGLYGVNTVCGAIYLYGFYRFARREQEPLLMLAISIPYQVIVTVMGYTRQGVAVGLLMWGISYLYEKKPIRFLCAILIAAGFHSSALSLAPLACFGFDLRKRPIAWISGVSAGLVALSLVMGHWAPEEKFDLFYQNYVESNHYSSEGALVRSAMSALAALVFLSYWRTWGRQWGDRNIWLAFSLVSLAMVPLTFVASTATDRTGLYLIPLQLVVFSRLPYVQGFRARRNVFVVMIVLGYALALGVWLYWGQFTSQLWLPYRSLLLGEVP